MVESREELEALEDCNGKYNLKDSSILSNKPGKSTMVRLPPERFLKLTTGKENPSYEEAKALGVNFRSAEGIHQAMCSEEPLDPMLLEYDQDKQRISGHEGRQRAMVAKEAGVSGIPVKLFCEEREDGRIKAKHCEVTSGIDLSRKAESQNDLTSAKWQNRVQQMKNRGN